LFYDGIYSAFTVSVQFNSVFAQESLGTAITVQSYYKQMCLHGDGLKPAFDLSHMMI